MKFNFTQCPWFFMSFYATFVKVMERGKIHFFFLLEINLPQQEGETRCISSVSNIILLSLVMLGVIRLTLLVVRVVACHGETWSNAWKEGLA